MLGAFCIYTGLLIWNFGHVWWKHSPLLIYIWTVVNPFAKYMTKTKEKHCRPTWIFTKTQECVCRAFYLFIKQTFQSNEQRLGTENDYTPNHTQPPTYTGISLTHTHTCSPGLAWWGFCRWSTSSDWWPFCLWMRRSCCCVWATLSHRCRCSWVTVGGRRPTAGQPPGMASWTVEKPHGCTSLWSNNRRSTSTNEVVFILRSCFFFFTLLLHYFSIFIFLCYLR